MCRLQGPPVSGPAPRSPGSTMLYLCQDFLPLQGWVTSRCVICAGGSEHPVSQHPQDGYSVCARLESPVGLAKAPVAGSAPSGSALPLCAHSGPFAPMETSIKGEGTRTGPPCFSSSISPPCQQETRNCSICKSRGSREPQGGTVAFFLTPSKGGAPTSPSRPRGALREPLVEVGAPARQGTG